MARVILSVMVVMAPASDDLDDVGFHEARPEARGEPRPRRTYVEVAAFSLLTTSSGGTWENKVKRRLDGGEQLVESQTLHQ